MTVNATSVSGRNMRMDPQITANGSFTLPRFVFIPHPALQQLSSGRVNGPTLGVQSADIVASNAQQRPYPIPYMPDVYGVRQVQIKSSPPASS